MASDTLVERLRALHVWPQFVADAHADVILPRQSKGLYEVGEVAHQAADRIEALEAALREMLQAMCGETGFAAAVRQDTAKAYPWPALDIAEERARDALEEQQP